MRTKEEIASRLADCKRFDAESHPKIVQMAQSIITEEPSIFTDEEGHVELEWKNFTLRFLAEDQIEVIDWTKD
jgi:hypothetical protein